MYSRKIMLSALCVISCAQGMQGTVWEAVSTAGGFLGAAAMHPAVLTGVGLGVVSMLVNPYDEGNSDNLLLLNRVGSLAKSVIASAVISHMCGEPANGVQELAVIARYTGMGMFAGQLLMTGNKMLQETITGKKNNGYFHPTGCALVKKIAEYHVGNPGILTAGAGALVLAGYWLAGKR